MPIYESSPSSTRPAIYFKRISKRFQQKSTTTTNHSPALAPNLPPELWLHVVSQLDTPDASSLSLTCRSLCDIAQPALFESVVFNPFVDPDIISLERPAVLNLRSESSYRKKLTKRLDFFSTPRIRHAVKHVCIGPSGKMQKRCKLLDDMAEAIMQALPHFCNLTSLICKQLDLTPERMSMFQQLPLKSVLLESCTSSNDDISQLSLHPMCIEKVTFTSPSSSTEESMKETASNSSNLRSLFLHPEHLRSLHTSFTQDILSTLAGAAAPFYKLRDLELPVLSTSSAQFPKALSHCPKLRRLSFLADTEIGIPPLSSSSSLLPAESLPLLSHYRGPRLYILKIAAPRPVRHLDIYPACKPERLIRTLGELDGMQITRTLETLTVRYSQPPPAVLLLQIHQTFPYLRNLTLKGVYLDMTQWVDMLKTATPHHYVRHLRMCVCLGEDEYGGGGGGGGGFWRVPEHENKRIVQFFNHVHPLLLQAYPRLKKVQAVSASTGALAIWRRVSSSSNNNKETSSNHSAMLEIGDSMVEIGLPGLRKARSF